MICYKNLSFSYGNSKDKSIKDISFSIEKGKCILLIGKSGCGKTTITRFINGLIPNFYKGEIQGDVYLENQNINNLSMNEISQKVGSVFQNPKTQFFNTNTTEEIAFALENLSIKPSLIRELVDKTYKNLNMENLRDRNIFELSGGEKQKIAFASIYAMNPEIYVLDEPSSNLDCKSINEIKHIIKILKSQNKTIIISEHRTYYLMDLIDEVFYIDRGIVKDKFTKEEFKRISNKELNSLGIRASILKNICPNTKSFYADSSKRLTINHVKAGYKNNNILQDISFTAKMGECIGILGENGCGKTTLSKVLCGLHKETAGEILFKGKRLSTKERIKLSYLVMQDVNYQLFGENVENESHFGLQGISKEQIDNVLKSLGLLGFKKQHPNTLSGGQKQRLVIATSILNNKSIYFFDEPTSGQDYESMMQVSTIINNLKNGGNLIFIITHDYEFLCNTCTRAIFIKHGKIHQDINLLNEKDSLEIREFFTKGY